MIEIRKIAQRDSQGQPVSFDYILYTNNKRLHVGENDIILSVVHGTPAADMQAIEHLKNLYEFHKQAGHFAENWPKTPSIVIEEKPTAVSHKDQKQMRREKIRHRKEE